MVFQITIQSGANSIKFQQPSTTVQGPTLYNFNVCYPDASSPPPSPSPPPPDGAVLELTGTEPKILFGPQDAPVCSLSLDSAAGSIISTCALTTSSGRRLENSDALVSRTEHEALKAEHEALKAEVAKLSHIWELAK
jgi:hypothetical protein